MHDIVIKFVWRAVSQSIFLHAFDVIQQQLLEVISIPCGKIRKIETYCTPFDESRTSESAFRHDSQDECRA